MADTQEVDGVAEQVAADPALVPAGIGNGLGIPALVVGVLALAGSFLPHWGWVAALLAVVALVLGSYGLTEPRRRRGLAIAGTIASAAALLNVVVLPFVLSPAWNTPSADHVAPTGVDESGSQYHRRPGEVGTRENPAPIGTPVVTGSAEGLAEWEVTLGSPILDADDVIAAANESAETPPEGFQYAIVPVTVVYHGTETGAPWADLAVDFVSAAGTAHASRDTFAVAPQPLTDVGGLARGESGTGNVVVAIPSADAEEGAWVVSTILGDQYFFTAR